MEVYSEVIDNSDSRKKIATKKTPSCVEETEGHPSIVIVQVTCLLTELLVKADDKSDEFVDEGSGFQQRQKDKTKGFITTDTFHVAGIKYALGAEMGSREIVEDEVDTCYDKTTIGRRGMLLLLQTLSILVHWEHNKIVFQSRLGSTFATNFIGVIRFLISQLDGFVLSWYTVKDNAIDIDHPALSDLRNDTSFVFSSLVLISQFIAKSCPSIVNISQKTHCGFLPPQPWRSAELQAFGYDSLLEDSDEVSNRRSRFDSTDDNLLNTVPILDAFSSCTQPLMSNFKEDAWCGMLIAAGGDNVIIDIVRKLSDLSKMLALAPSLTRSDSEDLYEGKEGNGTKLTVEEKWTITAYDIWKKCVVLQNEVLFALIGFVSTHPIATSNRFLVCEGALALNTMLLDSNTFANRKNPLTNSLVFRRGLLCLRLNELVTQHFSASSDSNTIFFPEALGWFLSWMRKTYSYSGENIVLNDDDYLENVVGCVESSNEMDIVEDSDLWPWGGMGTNERGTTSSVPISQKKQRSYTNQCYRMCHKVESGTRNKDSWDEKLNLEEWAIYSENALKDDLDTEHFDLPWFLRGKAARAWHIVFSILIFTTYSGTDVTAANGSGKDFDKKRVRSIESFELIISAVFSSLGEKVVGKQDEDAEDDTHECIPVFQMHILLFIARCIYRRPVNVIEYFCDREEIWKSLFGASMFLGGRRAVIKICDISTSNQVKKTVSSEDASSKSYVLEPVMSCASVEGTLDDVKSHLKPLDSSTYAEGFMWFYVHDSVLDLTTLLIRTANTPPTNRIISTKKGFEIKPVIQALQLSSEKGYDDVTFQLLKWMGWYLQLFSTKSIVTRDFLSSHFFRAALAVCGYQLSDIGAFSILQKESDENPLFVKERQRLFMWSSRKAALGLVDYILDLSGCDKWVSLFLSKERDDSTVLKRSSSMDARNSPLPSSRKTKTPAHQTLVVLLLDNNLRHLLVKVILKILERLMKEVITDGDNSIKSEVDDAPKMFFLQNRAYVQNSDGDQALTIKKSVESHHARMCAQAIQDIFSDMFEHVKCASRQPAWYEGWQAVDYIFGGITHTLRSLRHSPEVMHNYQSFFRRGPLISDLICSVISCVNFAKDSSFWTSDLKSRALYRSLACLTAIMMHDSMNKAEFKSIMMTQLSRRSSVSGKSDAKQLLFSQSKESSSSSIVIRYDEFTGMILAAQGDTHFETILVLFEMILDSHIYNCETILDKYSSDPKLVSEGFFSDEFDRPQICNLSAIPLVFGILPHCSDDIQICVLNSFHSLVVGRNSLINVSTCTSHMQPSLLDHVLDVFPQLNENVQECAVALLQTLGKHSISVAQLKHLFQMMQSKGEYRPVYTSLLVRSLQGMINNEDAPRHSFVFSGIDSGLEIPSIPRWPATSAFTFSVWLRVESPLYNSFFRESNNMENTMLQSQGALALEYRPYILSLRADNGSGLEIFLKKHSSNRSHKFRICIRCFDSKGGEPDTLMLPGKYINEGQWHYLAVSHRSSTGFGKRNEIEIMLDDKFVRQKFSFPHFGDDIQNPLIGSCDAKFKGKDANFNTTMRGQMSAIYLFADALSEGQLRGIHALGPSYFYSFEPYDTVRRDIPQNQNSSDKKVTVDPVLSVLDSSLTSLIALAYNPAVWKNDLFLDNTPEKNGVKWKSGNFLGSTGTFAIYGGVKNSRVFSKIDSPYYSPGRMHARGLPGTYRDTTSDVRIALNSLGGIKALLPLFAQFDQPRFKPSRFRREMFMTNFSTDCKSDSEGDADDVDKTLDSRICLVVMELLRTLLVESSENEVLLRDVQATSLISYFLVRMSPQHMSLDALNIIILVYQRVAWNNTFPLKVVEHFLLNFKLWVFTPFEVQKRLMETLEEILSSIEIKFLRDVNVVQILLNALYLLYGYKKPNLQNINVTSSASSEGDVQQRRSSYTTSSESKNFLEAVYVAEKWINAGTGEVMGEKLVGDDLQFIRKKIISLIEIVIRRGDRKGHIFPRDVSAVISYVVSAETSQGKVEALEILFSLLTKPSTTSVEKNAALVLAGCALERGLLALIPLFSDESIKVRLFTLLILCTALTQAIVHDNIYEVLAEDTFVIVDDPDDKKSDRISHFKRFSVSAEYLPQEEDNIQPDSSPRAGAVDCIMDFSESDTLNSLGLPIPSLVGIMLLIQEDLLKGLPCQESQADVASVAFQAKFITQAIMCTFIGESCTYLVDELRHLPMDNQGESTSSDDKSNLTTISSDAWLESIVKCKATFYETIDLDNKKSNKISEQLICIPMIFPSLLCIIMNRDISIGLRLSAMVSLKTIILQSDDNTDHILRISAWQDNFLQLLFELYRQKSEICEMSPDCDRLTTKYATLMDTAMSTICEIQVTAIRIGHCLGQSYVVTPFAAYDRMKLTPDLVFSETKSGERQLGVCVIRETMVLLKLYTVKYPQLQDFITKVSFSLLLNTANALQREYELVQAPFEQICKNNSVEIDSESNITISAYHILHLNQWLFGVIVEEYLETIKSNSIVSETSNCSPEICDDSLNLVLSICKLLEFIKKPHQSTRQSVNSFGSSSKAHISWLSNKEVIERSVSGAVSVVLSVLCSFLELGSRSECSIDNCMKCLAQLDALLTILQNHNYHNLEYECATVFARLVLILKNSSLSLTSEWVQGVLALLVRYMDESLSILLKLIDATIVGQQPSDSFLALLTKSIPAQLVPVAIRDSIAHISVSDLHSLSNITLGPGSSVNIEVLLSGCDKDANVADATLDIVKKYLGLIDLPTFSWDYLIALVVPIVQESDKVREEASVDQFNGIGLHRKSDDVGLQIEHQRDVRSHIFDEVSVNLNDSHKCCKLKHRLFIEQHFRRAHASDRRVLSKWNNIISGLANERGPWGYGSNQEAFWTIDMSESNTRMHNLMRRNENGTRHQMATLLASTKGKRVAPKDDDSSSLEQVQSDNLDDDFAVLSSQNLWKDITKYHKNSPAVADDQQDVEDDIVDGVQQEEINMESSPMVMVDTGKVLFKSRVEIVTAATNSSGGLTIGTLEVTKSKMIFTRENENENFDFENRTKNTEFLWACQCFPSTTWNTAEILNVYHRHYQQRNCGLEFFFTTRLTAFMVFADKATARSLYTTVRRQIKPPHIVPHYGHKPISIMNRAMHTDSFRTVTQAWVYREISNYDYLMFCNTVAGRSYNDLSQYPVFPWIIANYSTSKLNLNDPKSFRDLKWPMGAQSERQREVFQRRYVDLASSYYADLEMAKRNGDTDAPDSLPPFHYGSHYSTMGFVLWYLVRHEPFTSLNIWMQDGRFDKTDRIFDSMEMCYKGVTSNQSDVKELIPEFFYCSEFLQNPNNIDLGVTQGDNPKKLGDVGLPPWAKTAKDFVRLNRMALESEYVSANLHHWIDLIFGYKQRPSHMGGSDESVEACNVYFHLTYNGAVDLDKLKANDTMLYDQIVRQISNFGQTPSLLFRKPHPQRLPIHQVDMFWPLASVVLGADTIPKGAPLPERPRRVVCFKEHQISEWPIVLIGEITSNDKLITIDTSRIIGSHFWQVRPPDVVPPFQIKTDIAALRSSQGIAGNSTLNRLTNSGSTSKEKRIGVPFAPQQLLRSDFVYDVSARETKLPKNNKAQFEKEESSRSNWRVRPHGSRSTFVKSNSTATLSPEKSPGDNSSSSPSRRASVSSKAGHGDRAITLQRVDEHISNHLFALLPDHRLLFSCGHWDYAIKVSSVETGRLMQSVSYHKDVVTCMDLATDFGNTWLVTGSRDCTVIIWEINPSLELPILPNPLHLLYGHDDAVNCVSVSPELDIVVSGSDDGTIIVHKLRDGIYVRSISLQNVIPSVVGQGSERHTGDVSLSSSPTSPSKTSTSTSGSSSLMTSTCRIHYVGISHEGYILAYSNDDTSLYSFTINGEFAARKIVGERLHVFQLSEDNKVLITGGERALLVMRWVHSLELSNVGSKWEFDAVLDGSNAEEEFEAFNSPIRSMYLTKHERHLIVGLESGELRILAQVSNYYTLNLLRVILLSHSYHSTCVLAGF